MYYHGADGIHVGFDIENGNMHLYWGESKMYLSLIRMFDVWNYKLL